MSTLNALYRLRLVLAALRWRAASSVVMVTIAAVGIAAAAAGPLYVHAADQSVLDAQLAAGAPGTGLTLIPSAGHEPLGSLRTVAAAAPRSPSGLAAFGSPIYTADASIRAVSQSSGQDFTTDLVSRSGVCAYLHIVEGICPTAPRQIALSTRTAQALGMHLGQTLVITAPRSGVPIRLSVGALYLASHGDGPQWWGDNPFGFGTGTPQIPRLDDVFATQQTVTGTLPEGDTSYLAQIPLKPRSIPASATKQFTSALSAYASRAAATDAVSVSSGMFGVVARVAGDQHSLTTVIVVIDIQLVLLALLVLYFLAARTAESREPEIRLADLRGFRRLDTISVTLLEPLLLLCIALPTGLAAAAVTIRLASPHLFGSGVVSDPGLTTVFAGLAAFAVGVLAAVIGVRRVLRRQQPGGAGRIAGTSAVSVALDFAAVTLALVAFLEVVAGGVSKGTHTDPLAAFAPGLLAFAAGVLGARFLPVAARSTLSMSKDSRWVATFLSTRRVARQRELSRQIVVVSMAVGLSVFAIVGWAVASRNRSIRAGFEVGADRVLTVQVRPGVSLLAAVHRADPRGRWAMAAVVENAADGTLLAVDADRLANVASWPPGFGGTTLAAIARRLSPHTAPPVILSGSALRVTADVPPSVPLAAELEASVFDDAYQTTSTLDLGTLQSGVHDYTALLAGDCSDACRLVNLGIAWSPPVSTPSQTTAARLTVRSLSVERHGEWRPVDAALSNPVQWQSESDGVRINRGVSGNLSVRAIVDADGAAASFGPADVPKALPAVTTGDQMGAASQPRLAVGLDGSTIDIRSVGQVNTLPRVGPGASMVDLALAERSQTGPMLDTTSEVWVSSKAPPTIVRMLQVEGVSVLSDQSVGAQDAVLGSGGMSLAYSAFLLAAVAAALLAVGSTAMAGVATGRRRKAELAAMGAVGLDRRDLRRWLFGEQSLIVFTGVVLGAAAGVVGAAVALRSVPEFVGLGPAPPLEFSLPLGNVALCVAALVLALATTIILTTSGVLRSVTWRDLGGEDN